MGATASPASRHWARLGALAALVVVAGLLLPLSAYAVEAIAEGAENWIIVVQLALMTVIGAGLGRVFGRLGPQRLATAPRMATWAAAGLLAALLADAFWLLLLAG